MKKKVFSIEVNMKSMIANEHRAGCIIMGMLLLRKITILIYKRS